MREHLRTVSLYDLSGGVNLAQKADAIADNQLSDGRNIVYGPQRRPQKRPGNVRLNGSALGGTVRWLHSYRSGTGGAYLLAGVDGTIKETGSATFGTFANIKTGLNATARLCGVTVQGRCYITNGVDAPFRVDGTGVGAMGVATPDVTSLMLGAAAGTELEVGAYSYRISFVYHGFQESNASAAKTVSTTGGNERVQLTAIPTGAPGSGVTARRIYRSVVGGTAEKLVAIIADNTTATYLDVIPDSSLGADYLSAQGSPPTAGIIEYLPDSRRMVMGRGTTLVGFLYYSEPDYVDVFKSANTYRICEGKDITSFRYLHNRGLMVWNENETYLCYGEDPLVWKVTRLSSTIGCMDHDSVQVRHVQGEPWVIWRGNEHLYYYNGSYIAVLSKEIDTELPKIPQSFRRTFSASTDWDSGTSTAGIDRLTVPSFLRQYKPQVEWTTETDFSTYGLPGFMKVSAEGYAYPRYFGSSEGWSYGRVYPAEYGTANNDVEIATVGADTVVRLAKYPISVSSLQAGGNAYNDRCNIMGATGSAQTKSKSSSISEVYDYNNWHRFPQSGYSAGYDTYGNIGFSDTQSLSVTYGRTFPALQTSSSEIYLHFQRIPRMWSYYTPMKVYAEYQLGGVWTGTQLIDEGYYGETTYGTFANGGVLNYSLPVGCTGFRLVAYAEYCGWYRNYGMPSNKYWYNLQFYVKSCYIPGCAESGYWTSTINLLGGITPGPNFPGPFPDSHREIFYGQNGTITGDGSHYLGCRFSWDGTTWTDWTELAANTVSGTIAKPGGGTDGQWFRQVRLRFVSPGRSGQSAVSLLFPRAYWLSRNDISKRCKSDIVAWTTEEITSTVPAGVTVTQYIRSHATDLELGTWAEVSGGDISAQGSNALIQACTIFQKTSTSTNVGKLEGVKLNYSISSTWTSAVLNFGTTVTAWGLFQANYVAGAETISFHYKLGTTAGNVDSDSWHALTPGTIPSEAVKQYCRMRITLATDNPDDLPYVDSFFWYWTEGGAETSLKLSSAFFRDKYYHSTWDRGGTAPTSIWVLDENTVWLPKWTGLTVHSMAVHTDGNLYLGSSDQYVYKHGYGYRDNATAIDAWFKTKEFYRFVPEDQETDERYYAGADVCVEGTGDFDNTFSMIVDRGTQVDFTVNSSGTGRVTKTCSPSAEQQPYLHGCGVQFKFANNGMDQDFELHAISLRYYPKSRRVRHI